MTQQLTFGEMISSDQSQKHLSATQEKGGQLPRPLEWSGDMVEQNKRARANGEVKQEQQQEEEEEVEEGEVSQEETQRTGAFPLVTMAAMEQTEEETQIDVRIAVALLHCHACLQPLKPPVFKVTALC